MRRCISRSWQHSSMRSFSSFPHRRFHNETWLSAAHFTGEACLAYMHSCVHLSELNQIHAQTIKSGLSDNPVSAFLSNNFIRSYVRLQQPSLAFSTFVRASRVGILPDNYTFPAVLKAVGQIHLVSHGRMVHCASLKLGLATDVFVQSGLVHMYAKFGDFDEARQVFAESTEKKLGSFNAVISGFVQGGRGGEAMTIFVEVGRAGLVPDDVTIVSILPACAVLGNMDLALQIHACAVKVCLGTSDLLAYNALIDVFGKCGRLDLAGKLFDEMPDRNVSTWTSMIVGMAANGLSNEALSYFTRMLDSSVAPNHVTFVGVLCACVHAGLIDEGLRYFDEMVQRYQIVPRLQHYGCVVDLLGRAGRLREAKEMIESMPMKPNVVIWGALLGACEKHVNVEIGEWAAKHLMELEPESDGVYVVLSNIYASVNMWDKVRSVRNKMKMETVAKTPGYAAVSFT